MNTLAVIDISALYQTLSARTDEHATALRFLILTGARPGEVTGMRWGELDQSNRQWLIPADRTKTKTPATIPLSTQAMALIASLKPQASAPYVFMPDRGSRPIDAATKVFLNQLHPGAHPADIRTLFREWAASHHPGHDDALLTTATKTEATYRRGDMLEKRAVIMQEWADYAAPVQLVLATA